MELLHGVGYNDRKYPSKIKGKSKKEYKLWQGIIERCYSENSLKTRPTYRGCTISNNFRSYSYFYEWCNIQIGFGNTGWQIDKDILIKGNKIYSEDTCVFVPSQINSLFTKRELDRGSLPIGVTHRPEHSKYKFMARCNFGNGAVGLGSYNTPEDAFYAYKKVKEEHIKHMADLYKDVIDSRVYEAMYCYEVEITD